MIKVCFVRGKYLNNFEGQNYIFSQKWIRFTAVSSLKPLNSHFPFPVQKLPSLADIPLFERGVKYLGNRLLGDSQILFGLEKFAGRFDIYHTADPHYYYSYQLAKLRKKNLIKKLLATSWETIPFNNESVERKKYIKYYTLRLADHFICYTNKAKVALRLEGVNESKIDVVKLGVDLNRFKFPKKSQLSNFKTKTLTILFVGRLVEEKGVLDLYEAYKKVRRWKIEDRRWNIRLKIVGDGRLKNKMLSLIDDDGLADLVSLEEKDYDEMPRVYQEADIFVLPSWRSKTWEEQYGMVLLEAMASGLPIIAYDSGAISEVIGDAGILVKERDLNNLTISIKHLIEMSQMRAKLGKMGRERAEREFDAKKTAAKIKEIYENISGNPDKK